MNILIGITGSISAYKIPNLIRLFVKSGHNVKIIQTKASINFVPPYLLYALTNTQPFIEEFNKEDPISHINLAKWADLFIIAPISANTISKLACGLGDNLLTSTFLAYPNNKPVFMFPAMNVNMYQNKIIQENINKLNNFDNIKIFPTETGSLACGEDNKPGRLLEPEIIYELSLLEYERFNYLKKNKSIESNFILNKNIALFMGKTYADIDPVRFITNKSSGKMGIALAKSFYIRGAKLFILIDKETFNKYKFLKYISEKLIFVYDTEEALTRALEIIKDTDIIISASAFSDFKSLPNKDKIKKQANSSNFINLQLPIASDVLKTLANYKKANQIFIGFSLETNDGYKNALTKLQAKKLDFIILNTNNVLGQIQGDFSIILSNKWYKIEGLLDFLKTQATTYILLNNEINISDNLEYYAFEFKNFTKLQLGEIIAMITSFLIKGA